MSVVSLLLLLQWRCVSCSWGTDCCLLQLLSIRTVVVGATETIFASCFITNLFCFFVYIACVRACGNKIMQEMGPVHVFRPL